MTTLATTISWLDVREPPRLAPWHGQLPKPGLNRALGLIEAAVGTHSDGLRRVPSAGKCYPWEILLAPAGSTMFGRVDVSRRSLIIHSDEVDAWDGDRFQIFLIGRPWLSMRRYGRRGYLYHLIDAGHALFNLSLFCAAGTEPALGVVAAAGRACLQDGGAAIGWGELGRDIDPPAPPSEWRIIDVPQGARSDSSEFERAIQAILPAPAPALAFQPGPGWYSEPDLELLGRRHSAAGFHPTEPLAALAEVVELIGEHTMRLKTELGIEAPTLHVFSSVDGVGRPAPTRDWIAGALAGQTSLSRAQVYLAMHAPVTGALAMDPDIQHRLVACGLVGQLSYLAATRAGVGVTGIGGFDPDLWAQACQTNDEVLYLVALGAERAGEKLDRTATVGGHVQ